MKDIIIDTLLDAIKLLPFLLITFIIIEYIEQKFSKSNEEKLIKVKKFGPFLGGLLGAIPQCGFSSMASSLYSTRVISLGTLISIYLSTSDEMLPLMISYHFNIKKILLILIIKIIIGMTFGILIDLILRKKEKEHIKDFCKENNCDCENEGIILPAVKHTTSVLIYILIISFILNIILENYGVEILKKILMHGSNFQVLLSSLIGLIPNCSSSIVLTELYLKDIVNIGSLIGGLLVNSGVGLLILFRYNKNIKENILIVLILYMIGIISGIIINLIGVI